MENIEKKSDNIINELNAVHEENRKLKEEIDELKELIKNK